MGGAGRRRRAWRVTTSRCQGRGWCRTRTEESRASGRTPARWPFAQMLAHGLAEALELLLEQTRLFLERTFDLVARRVAQERTHPLHPARAHMGGTAAQRVGKIAHVA